MLFSYFPEDFIPHLLVLFQSIAIFSQKNNVISFSKRTVIIRIVVYPSIKKIFNLKISPVPIPYFCDSSSKFIIVGFLFFGKTKFIHIGKVRVICVYIGFSSLFYST